MKTKRVKDSLTLAFAAVTSICTVVSVFGITIQSILPLKGLHWVIRILIYFALVLASYALLSLIIWLIKGAKYKNTITLKIGKNDVTIRPGNIFSESGWRVIPVDTHFSTTVDDVVISKTSLHGQMVLDHCDLARIKDAVKTEADRRGLQEDNGQYSFPLGPAIHCEGKTTDKGPDGDYIMLALTKLNSDNEAHTTMAQYEHTLMEAWKEINRVYNGNNIVLPLLGAGITRFDDDQGDAGDLLRCMLCTLNTSKQQFNCKISVVIYNHGNTDLPLYEYKDLFKIAR